VPEIQKISRDMLEAFAKEEKYEFSIDSDGDVSIPFSVDESSGAKLTCYLMLRGDEKDLYSVLIMADKRVPKVKWGRALIVCNEWNHDKRWPKAYLRTKDLAASTEAEIRLESEISLHAGIHQELLSEFSRAAIASAFSFWKWAHTERGL
jgi:hypothetical protein